MRYFILLNMPARRQSLTQTFVVNQQHLSAVFIDRIASRCKVLFMIFRGLEDGLHNTPLLYNTLFTTVTIFSMSASFIPLRKLRLIYAFSRDFASSLIRFFLSCRFSDELKIVVKLYLCKLLA